MASAAWRPRRQHRATATPSPGRWLTTTPWCAADLPNAATDPEFTRPAPLTVQLAHRRAYPLATAATAPWQQAAAAPRAWRPATHSEAAAGAVAAWTKPARAAPLATRLAHRRARSSLAAAAAAPRCVATTHPTAPAEAAAAGAVADRTVAGVSGPAAGGGATRQHSDGPVVGGAVGGAAEPIGGATRQQLRRGGSEPIYAAQMPPVQLQYLQLQHSLNLSRRLSAVGKRKGLTLLSLVTYFALLVLLTCVRELFYLVKVEAERKPCVN